MRNRHKQNSERGAAMIEFALVCVFFFIPMLLGITGFGLNLIRGIQVTQLNRDADQMYSRGVDFSIATNRQMLLRLAGTLNITDSGGDGVIILSTFQCTGATSAVCTRRITIGNASVRSSAFANPTMIDAGGNVDPMDPNSNASTFLGVLTMQPGDLAYVAETYFTTTDLNVPGLPASKGLYARAIF